MPATQPCVAGAPENRDASKWSENQELWFPDKMQQQILAQNKRQILEVEAVGKRPKTHNTAKRDWFLIKNINRLSILAYALCSFCGYCKQKLLGPAGFLIRSFFIGTINMLSKDIKQLKLERFKVSTCVFYPLSSRQIWQNKWELIAWKSLRSPWHRRCNEKLSPAKLETFCR